MAIVDERAFKVEYMSAWARECDLKEAGRAEGKAESVLSLLKMKGDISEELEAEIKTLQDEKRLDEMLLCAAKVDTVDEFVAKYQLADK